MAGPTPPLCRHLASEAPGPLAIEPEDVLEWEAGRPVAAAVRCGGCEGAGLLELVDRDRAGRVELFALSGLDPAALALFRRNRARGSCDLERLEREAGALLASAGHERRLVARDPTGEVLAAAPLAPAALSLATPWRERRPAAGDERWFALLGLAK